MSATDAIPSDRRVIRNFFDAIAFRYDFLNTLLSFKLDKQWRKKSVKLVLEDRQQTILDLGIGTGKFLNEFLAAKPWRYACGLDFSSGMLNGARADLPKNVSLVSADFHALPFPDRCFDLIISSFTLRSVKDMPAFLKGIFRVLAPSGKVAFLCLTRPKNFIWKLLYYPYLKIYLPLVGGLFSGRKDAYRFLSASIMSFQAPSETAEMMRESGFARTEIHSLSMGMATLIVGLKD